MGKGLKSVLAPKPKPESIPPAISNTDEHGQFSFSVVYANELAKSALDQKAAQFPAGAILVREKKLFESAATPEIVIAMIKRENGFNKDTGDWEFFTFNGSDLKLKARETAGECAKCHAQAAKTDWVFLDTLR